MAVKKKKSVKKTTKKKGGVEKDSPSQKYFKSRLKSKDFQKRLQTTFLEEIDYIQELKVKEVVGFDLIESSLKNVDVSRLDRELVSGLVEHQIQALEKHLKKQKVSIKKTLDKKCLDALYAYFDEPVEFTGHTKSIVREIVQSEFISDILTNLIYNALLSFNKKVNPVFGGLTTTLLDSKIKKFISGVLRSLLDQMVEFIVHPKNQDRVQGFNRMLVEILIKEDMSLMLSELTKGQRKAFLVLLDALMSSEKFQKESKKLLLVLLKEFYSSISEEKFGDIAQIKGQEKIWASAMVKAVEPFFSHEPILAFLTDEYDLAVGTLEK